MIRGVNDIQGIGCRSFFTNANEKKTRIPKLHSHPTGVIVGGLRGTAGG